MARRASLMGLVLVLAALAGPAAGQPVCDHPTTNDWLRPGSNFPSGAPLERSLAHPVTHDLADAVALLETRPAIPLGWQDAVRFVTAPFPGRRFRPYLVRAVFPTPDPSLRVIWSGADLHIVTNGLGCAPFVKHPVIVFLDRAPGQVFVWASSAL